MAPAEQAELESIVRANTLLGVLKTEAHAFLAHAKPSWMDSATSDVVRQRAEHRLLGGIFRLCSRERRSTTRP